MSSTPIARPGMAPPAATRGTASVSAALTSALVAALVALMCPPAPVAQERVELPHVREMGAALAQFDDGLVHAVAAYYHSQRHHDTPWLLVELGINSQKTVRLHRDNIELVTPAGITIGLASYRRWSQDVSRAARLMQAAVPTRHQVPTYFREYATVTPLQFFQAPHAGGTIRDIADLTLDQVFVGDLLFESPTGAFERGRHVLTIHNAVSTVRLPIDLR